MAMFYNGLDTQSPHSLSTHLMIWRSVQDR